MPPRPFDRSYTALHKVVNRTNWWNRKCRKSGIECLKKWYQRYKSGDYKSRHHCYMFGSWFFTTLQHPRLQDWHRVFHKQVGIWLGRHCELQSFKRFCDADVDKSYRCLDFKYFWWIGNNGAPDATIKLYLRRSCSLSSRYRLSLEDCSLLSVWFSRIFHLLMVFG